MSDRVNQRREEFHDFVWDHSEDAFQAKFDICAALTDDEAATLKTLLSSKHLHDHDSMAAAVQKAVFSEGVILVRLLQMAGLTRNKIVQDLKAYARKRKLKFSTSSPRSVFGSSMGAELASRYLAKQLQRVFVPAAGSITVELLEVVNQSTWPGFIRQERAKRMGHEAEYRLACLFRDCGLAFAPEAKAINPLCADVLIDGMSYDLVAPTRDDARLRILSTVHTANLGQYGESKDDLEIRKAINTMRRAGDRTTTTLLAFIDGVGYESNRAGLHGVLENADEFCQFRTIWKAAVLAAQHQQAKVIVALPSDQLEHFQQFCDDRHATLVTLEDSMQADDGWLLAGDGRIHVKKTSRAALQSRPRA